MLGRAVGLVTRLAVLIMLVVIIAPCLQNCDLSGSDLQHANLRGANIEGASLQDVVI